MFIPKARPELNWTHEKASLAMFEHLLKVNNLKLHGDESLEKDLKFINELIDPQDPVDSPDGMWPYEGRPEEKSFLYEIVSNKRNGIDVDKWDYFARDCHQLGIKNSFDHNRFIKFARVCKVKGRWQICTREQEVGNLYDFFHTRNCLHRRAYQHKVKNIVETMITEAFVSADNHLQFEGSNGKMCTMSTAIEDMVAYTKLTDNVFEQILFSTSMELAGAREILTNILSRRLYKCVGQFYSANEIQDTMAMCGELAGDQGDPQVNKLKPGDFIVKVIKMNYGLKEKNPIDHVRFYRKSDLTKAFEIPSGQVSTLIPGHFQEWLIQVYCKRTDVEEKILRAAWDRLENWRQTQNEQAGAGSQ
ncbi:unnamed protein product [Gadus morhua 'NCC']